MALEPPTAASCTLRKVFDELDLGLPIPVPLLPLLQEAPLPPAAPSGDDRVQQLAEACPSDWWFSRGGYFLASRAAVRARPKSFYRRAIGYLDGSLPDRQWWQWANNTRNQERWGARACGQHKATGEIFEVSAAWPSRFPLFRNNH